jgi:hypothetical protein
VNINNFAVVHPASNLPRLLWTVIPLEVDVKASPPAVAQPCLMLFCITIIAKNGFVLTSRPVARRCHHEATATRLILSKPTHLASLLHYLSGCFQKLLVDTANAGVWWSIQEPAPVKTRIPNSSSTAHAMAGVCNTALLACTISQSYIYFDEHPHCLSKKHAACKSACSHITWYACSVQT